MPEVCAVPIQYSSTDMALNATPTMISERPNVDYVSDSAPAQPVLGGSTSDSALASIKAVASMMASRANNQTTLFDAMVVAGAATYSCLCGVYTAVGIQWNHIQQLYGAVRRMQELGLIEQMLEQLPQPSGRGATWATRAIVRLCSRLFIAQWPRASLPNAQRASHYNVDMAIVNRLGHLNQPFGGMDRMLAFLSHLTIVPDIVPFSRAEAVGSLHGTLTWSHDTAWVFEFRSRFIRSEE